MEFEKTGNIYKGQLNTFVTGNLECEKGYLSVIAPVPYF